jgi:hypothetical protein
MIRSSHQFRWHLPVQVSGGVKRRKRRHGGSWLRRSADRPVGVRATPGMLYVHHLEEMTRPETFLRPHLVELSTLSALTSTRLSPLGWPPIELQRMVLTDASHRLSAYRARRQAPAAVQSQRELRGFAVFDPADLNLRQTAAAGENAPGASSLLAIALRLLSGISSEAK